MNDPATRMLKAPYQAARAALTKASYSATFSSVFLAHVSSGVASNIFAGISGVPAEAAT